MFIPYNSFNKMQELYKFAFENKVRWIYNENCLYNSTATAFNVLKGYLHAKLGWNTCLKQDKLENKFFSVMYGTQCGTMYEIYKEIVSFCEEQVDKLNFPRRTSSIEIFRSPSYWNRDLLISWLDKMEKAEKELLNNGEIKEAEHVIIEEIFPRATLLRVFRDDFKKSERVKMLYRLRDDCIKYDITSLGAGSIGFIADYLEMFGLTEEEIWG